MALTVLAGFDTCQAPSPSYPLVAEPWAKERINESSNVTISDIVMGDNYELTFTDGQKIIADPQSSACGANCDVGAPCDGLARPENRMVEIGGAPVQIFRRLADVNRTGPDRRCCVGCRLCNVRLWKLTSNHAREVVVSRLPGRKV